MAKSKNKVTDKAYKSNYYYMWYVTWPRTVEENEPEMLTIPLDIIVSNNRLKYKPELAGTSHVMVVAVILSIGHSLPHTVTVVVSLVPKPTPPIVSVRPPPNPPINATNM